MSDEIVESSRPQVSRRHFLAELMVTPAVLALGSRTCGSSTQEAVRQATASQLGTTSAAGLIVREANPVNLETDFVSLNSFLTPNSKFYVRNHFQVPGIQADSWRLNIAGEVEKPLELSLLDLMKLPAETRVVTLECAGNGRAYLEPKAGGVQWHTGAAGTAEWTGVSLASVLEQAGLKPDALEIVLEGADKGIIEKPSKPQGSFHFSRSIPLSKLDGPGGVLLAYQMNGEVLPVSHGYPLRAIVPGWYGMASIKWLSRIVAVAEPFQGFFQTIDYTYWKQTEAGPSRVPVTDLQVKAQITSPANGAGLEKGKKHDITGYAWSGGDATVVKVEVSTDDGNSWSVAELLDLAKPYAWRRWKYNWSVPENGGNFTLLTRALDSKGKIQASLRDADRLNYMISHCVPVKVSAS